MAPRALLGGPNFLAGLHLPLSLLLGVASTAWRWAIERLLPLRELESSVALAAGRCSWAPGRGSVACAHGELSLGGMSEAGPGQGAALSRACGRRAAANAIKTRIGFETQNHGRTSHCVLETHQKAVLDASHHLPRPAQAPVQPALAAKITAAQIDYVRSCGARSPSEHCCDPTPRGKGAATALRGRQSVKSLHQGAP